MILRGDTRWTVALIVTALGALILLGARSPVIRGQTNLMAAGGTYAFGANAAPGTALLIIWNAETAEGAPPLLMMRGPAAWNNGTPLTIQVTNRAAGYKGLIRQEQIPSVAGEYTVTGTVNGGEARASFSIDPGLRLPRPSVRVALNPNTIVISWDQVPGAVSYEVGLGDAQRRIFFTSLTVRTLSRTFVGAFPFVRLRAVVAAYTFDMTRSAADLMEMPAAFLVSEGTTEFNYP